VRHGIGVALLLGALQASAQQDAPFCQILDRYDMPPWFVRSGYVLPAEVEFGDDVGLFHINGGGGLAYAQTDVGDFDLTGHYDVNVPTDDGGIDLPDQYGRVWLGGSYIYRRPDGYACRLDVAPGIYSDFKDLSSDDFAMPFTVSVIRSFDEQWSAVAGLAVFPGFDRDLDPRIGVRWAPVDRVTFDLMYPRSRILFNPQEDLELYAGLQVDRTSEYTLADDDTRSGLLMEETRWILGVRHPLGDLLRMTWEIGLATDRSVDFVRNGPRRDIEDAYDFTVGIGAVL
jgi:hypothetical protein